MKSTLAALALLIATAAAAAAGPARAVTAPAPVIAVAFEGDRVAFASGFEARDCNRVRIWTLSTRGVTKLGRKTHCERTSTGNSIAQLSLAGKRALWLAYVGGNTREWSLWTATASAPEPRRLRAATNFAGEPSPFQLGNGDGGLLLYSAGNRVFGLRADGSRAFSWTAPDRVVALATRDGLVAVASDDRTVTLLDARGRKTAEETYDTRVSAVQLVPGGGVLVERRTTLELRRAGTAREWTIPEAAILSTVSSTHLFYVYRGRVWALPLSGSEPARTVSRGTAAAVAGSRIAVADGRVVRLLATT